MKAGELNDWLGVITNIGVIAGLALLVYELSLTNRAVDLTFDEWRGSIAFDTNEMMSRVPLVLAEDPEMADIWDRASRGEELLGADRVRFDRLVTLHFYTRLQLYNVWHGIKTLMLPLSPRNIGQRWKMLLVYRRNGGSG